MAATVRLLIIDEVHLLNDERGPVIETLVARTTRQARRVELGSSGFARWRLAWVHGALRSIATPLTRPLSGHTTRALFRRWRAARA